MDCCWKAHLKDLRQADGPLPAGVYPPGALPLPLPLAPALHALRRHELGDAVLDAGRVSHLAESMSKEFYKTLARRVRRPGRLACPPGRCASSQMAPACARRARPAPRPCVSLRRAIPGVGRRFDPPNTRAKAAAVLESLPSSLPVADWVEEYRVPHTDSRAGLRGQLGVRVKRGVRPVPAASFVGLYR